MVEIPNDIKTGLTNLSKSLNIPIKDLLNELKDIINSDETIQTMEKPEFKIRYAYALLLQRYTTRGAVSQLYLRPLSRPRVRKVFSQGSEKYVANVYTLVRKIEQDDKGNLTIGDVQLAAGTLWEKAAENAKNLSPDKIYKTALRVTEASKGVELGGNDATFTEVTDPDIKFPTNEEFYKQFIEPKEKELTVELADLDLNNRDDLTDIRVIKAMVIDVGIGETASHVEFGRYTVTDNSMLVREEGSGPASYSIWVHPDDVVWDKGSTLKFVGTVNYDASASIARFDCFFVVPTEVAIKRKIEPKPVTSKESVEVELDETEKELLEEHEKVEKELNEISDIEI